MALIHARSLRCETHIPPPALCISTGRWPQARRTPRDSYIPPAQQPPCAPHGLMPPVYACTHTGPCIHGHIGHSHAHTRTPMYGHREAGDSRCAPAHPGQHTRSHPQRCLPGPALRWPSSRQRNADSWGCSASGREREAQGKPHGQESSRHARLRRGPRVPGTVLGPGGHVQTIAL